MDEEQKLAEQMARDTEAALSEARDHIMKASKILSYRIAEPYQAGCIADITALRNAYISVESKRIMISVDLHDED